VTGTRGNSNGLNTTARHPAARQRLKRRALWTLGVLLSIVTLVVVGDVIYSLAVGAKYRAWDGTVMRDADGVRAGCGAWSLGSGETGILLIHGFGLTPDMWRPMAGLLAEKGYACRAMRLPGFAVPVEDARVTLGMWRDAVAEEVRALAASRRRVFIMGHSMGAALAVDYALAHRGEVAGIALLAPLVEVSNRRSPVLSARSWHGVSKALLHFTTFTKTPYDADVRDDEARAALKREVFVNRSF